MDWDGVRSRADIFIMERCNHPSALRGTFFWGGGGQRWKWKISFGWTKWLGKQFGHRWFFKGHQSLSSCLPSLTEVLAFAIVRVSSKGALIWRWKYYRGMPPVRRSMIDLVYKNLCRSVTNLKTNFSRVESLFSNPKHTFSLVYHSRKFIPYPRYINISILISAC